MLVPFYVIKSFHHPTVLLYYFSATLRVDEGVNVLASLIRVLRARRAGMITNGANQGKTSARERAVHAV